MSASVLTAGQNSYPARGRPSLTDCVGSVSMRGTRSRSLRPIRQGPIACAGAALHVGAHVLGLVERKVRESVHAMLSSHSSSEHSEQVGNERPRLQAVAHFEGKSLWLPRAALSSETCPAPGGRAAGFDAGAERSCGRNRAGRVMRQSRACARPPMPIGPACGALR